jgi:hypothetical protein
MRARIFKPAKSAMSSGTAKTKEWVLEFVPASARSVDPLMGWTSSSDMNSQVRLRFDTLEAAGTMPPITGSTPWWCSPRRASPTSARAATARTSRPTAAGHGRTEARLPPDRAGRPHRRGPDRAARGAWRRALPAESNHHQDGAAMAAEGVVLFGGLLNGRLWPWAATRSSRRAWRGEVDARDRGGARAGRGARLLEMILDHARARASRACRSKPGASRGLRRRAGSTSGRASSIVRPSGPTKKTR